MSRGGGTETAHGNSGGAARRSESEAGLAFARAWRMERQARAATAPYPFRDHRTAAQLAEARGD